MPFERARIRGALECVKPYNALGKDGLEALAGRCGLVRLEPHEVLLHDGEPVRNSYILIEGCLTRSLVTPDGRTTLLNHTRPVTAFGGSALLDGSPHIGVIMAVEPSAVVRVPGEEVLRLLGECPQFALEVAHALAHSSVRQTEALLDLMFPVPVRLARLLCRRATKTGLVELDMSKASLAEMLGTVPETLSRALGALRREGLVQSDGRTLRVADLKKLQSYAQL